MSLADPTTRQLLIAVRDRLPDHQIRQSSPAPNLAQRDLPSSSGHPPDTIVAGAMAYRASKASGVRIW
jgi:hypothetical protein